MDGAVPNVPLQFVYHHVDKMRKLYQQRSLIFFSNFNCLCEIIGNVWLLTLVNVTLVGLVLAVTLQCAIQNVNTVTALDPISVDVGMALEEPVVKLL